MRLIILFGIVLLTNTKVLAQEVVEVAIYRVAESHQLEFTKLLTDFRAKVSRLPGYQDYSTLISEENPAIFIDILHWNTLKNALAASEKVKKEKQYGPFTSALDSLIFYGELYPFNTFIHQQTEANMKNNVTEVVAYQIKTNQVANYANISTLADNFAQKQPGFISRSVLQDHQDSSIFLDLVEWETLEDAQAAMQASQTEAALQPFFEATEKIISFSHYSYFK